MMATSAVQKDDNRNAGNARTPCPVHGCRRLYADRGALDRHVKDHHVPAQSLPGKALQCSTAGCGGSFPSMQKLMEHLRRHHKPNIFFLCESCRTKLRSYRGLLTHLHTCSKVPRGRTRPPEPAPPRQDQGPPRLDSQQVPSPDYSFPAAPPVLGPPFSSHPEPPPQLAPQHLTEAALQPLLGIAAHLPPPASLDGPPAAPDAQSQNKSLSPEPVHAAPGSAPHSPPGSYAVWKKTQGVAYSRRILWEHTKGRYTCVQCGQTATNRKEMTQHISSHHSGNKPADDAGS